MDEESCIGAVIKSLRIAHEMSVSDLAKTVGVTPHYLNDLEANRKKPSLDVITRCANALGVNRSTLLLFEERAKGGKYSNRRLLYEILQLIIPSDELSEKR